MPKPFYVSLLICTVGSLYAGSTPGSITLKSSASTSVLGRPLTITATIAPASATGKVTFYSGVTILGTAALSAGQAVMTTRLLPTGTSLLRAYYSGDPTYEPASSAKVPQTIRSLPAGAFERGATSPGNGSFTIAVADLNDDGYADLVTGTANGTVDIFLGNGDGTFRSGSSTPAFSTVDYVTFVSTGDFNGDGKSDVAAVSRDETYGVVLLGNGDGTFQPPVTYPTGLSPQGIAVADFNSDGIADIAVANYSENDVSILLGKGDGSFLPPLTFPAGSTPRSVVTGDFNGDGRVDLLVANAEAGTVSVLPGNDDGTFLPPIASSTSGSVVYSASVGDLNGDGKLDVVVGDVTPTGYCCGNNGASILLGKGDGTFEASRHIDLSWPPGGPIGIADLNGDGVPDLAASLQGRSNNNLQAYLGDGLGNFKIYLSEGSGFYDNWNNIAVADFNGDGINDIASMGDGVIKVMVGTSTPNLLVNPGADDGTLNGWWADNPLSKAFSLGGIYSFEGGNTPAAFITQTVNLSNVTGVTLAQVDSGNLVANYSFWFYDQEAANCQGQITLTFYDGSRVTGQGLSEILQKASHWINGAGSFAIPAGTRSINYTMDFLATTATNSCLIDDNFLTINQRPPGTSITLTSSLNPAFTQESVALTATISDPSAAGTVIFLDGSSTLGTVAVSVGEATLWLFGLTPGSHSLTAVYSKDSVNAYLTSAMLTQNVVSELVSNPITPVHPLTTNLLVNPGGEGGMTGWYPNVSGPFAGSPGHTGSASFQTLNSGIAFVTQTVSLASAAGISLAGVDSGALAANYSFWLSDRTAGSGCYGLVTLTFLDQTGSQAVGQGLSASLHPERSHKWLNDTGSFAIPPGSRYINYTMDFLTNSCAIDDNVLTISHPH
ncbi:MAG TPA: FG-GAP-like repeat-containing protein [Bryobacteraceae bacterium]|nr:FG-GAP-like repeat-containing protein [Bryobacteraceae bacterium]